MGPVDPRMPEAQYSTGAYSGASLESWLPPLLPEKTWFPSLTLEVGHSPGNLWWARVSLESHCSPVLGGLAGNQAGKWHPASAVRLSQMGDVMPSECT